LLIRLIIFLLSLSLTFKLSFGFRWATLFNLSLNYLLVYSCEFNILTNSDSSWVAALFWISLNMKFQLLSGIWGEVSVQVSLTLGYPNFGS
jgi:hypothetical protein